MAIPPTAESPGRWTRYVLMRVTVPGNVIALQRGALRDGHRSADRDRIAFDAGPGQERDRAPDRHRITPHVARDRDRAADRDRLVDGLVGADVERLAEHRALGPVTTPPLPPSFPP